MKGFGEKRKNPKKEKRNSNKQTIKDQILSNAFKRILKEIFKKQKSTTKISLIKDF